MVPAAFGPDPDGPCRPTEDGQHLRQRGRQAAGLPVQLRLLPILSVKLGSYRLAGILFH